VEDPYKRRFEQDRSLRDAARTLLQQDVEFLRGDNARRSVATRMADRAKSGASSAAEEASAFVSDNRGSVAGGAALAGVALAVALFRRPLFDLFCQISGLSFDPEQVSPPPHSGIEDEN